MRHAKWTGCAVAVLLIATMAGGERAQARTLFTLTGHGWGHGVGLSQWGADGYAQHGWGYRRILAHYYTGTGLGTLRPGAHERVLMLSRAGDVHVTVAGAAVAAAGGGRTRRIGAGGYRIEPGPKSGMLRLWSAQRKRVIWSGISRHLLLSPRGGPLRLGERVNGLRRSRWRGDFRIARRNGRLDLVDVVGIERYTAGVTTCEVPSSWPVAALRAQAVAVRSYARATRHPGASFDAYPDTRSQGYCPVGKTTARATAAARDTRRRIVTYRGSVATTFYSASSGGRTASPFAAWGGAHVPYLVSVRDRYDGAGGANPNHTWKPVRYRPAGLANALGLDRPVTSLDHAIAGRSQRVLALTAHTAGGTTRFKGTTVFARLGLRSNYFRFLQVSLSAPATVHRGRSFTLRGRLWPKPDSRWRLEIKRAGEGWQPAGVPIHLGRLGRFSVGRSPVHDIAYRVHRKGAFSPVVRVDVVP